MRDNWKIDAAQTQPLHARDAAEIERELAQRAARGPIFHPPLLLYGMVSFSVGIAAYLFGVLLVLPRYLLDLNAWLEPVSQAIVWYSGIPIAAGLCLALADLFLFLDHKRCDLPVRYRPLASPEVTVALTAYNDEESIGAAVRDFLGHPLVRRVIVVSNNSKDATFERAKEAGAITFNEELPGYGRCVHRCLSEAAKFTDTQCIVLCEGDCTFRAYDIEKLIAYAPHGDIVNGTRTVEPLRQYRTQLSTFLYYGNVFVAKLLEAKHLGRSTITDVGTTYKLCRRDTLVKLLGSLDPRVNLEFNAHFLDHALRSGHVVLECPVTFHRRVGASKGGNSSNMSGFKVGMRMICGILFGWSLLA